tara:strand:+ start:80 stop:280 length:201 start_codon:yes stop_codon:yes gene_type:complete
MECDCDTVCTSKYHYGFPKPWNKDQTYYGQYYGINGVKIMSVKEIAESPMLITFLKGFGSIKKATK